MPSTDGSSRVRSALTVAAAVAALAAGSAGLPAAAWATADAPMNSPVEAPSPTPTPAPEGTTNLVPDSVPADASAPSGTDAAPATPMPDPPADAGVTASAVVLPDPNAAVSALAGRTAPTKLGPSVTFVSTGKGLLSARMKSLNVKLDVAGAASLRAWVILPRSAVRAAEVDGPKSDRTLARLSVRAPMDGRRTLKLRFDGPAQEALLRFLKVTVVVRITATDAVGNASTYEQGVALSD